MNTLIEFEIGFYNEKKAYISITPYPSTNTNKYQEALLFNAYVLRHLGNFNPNAKAFIQSLINLKPENADNELILNVGPANPPLFNTNDKYITISTISTKDIEIVDYQGLAKKRFSGCIKSRGEKSKCPINIYGFGFLYRGIYYYSLVSIAIFLKHLAYLHANDRNFVSSLYWSANLCGQLALERKIPSINEYSLAIGVTNLSQRNMS